MIGSWQPWIETFVRTFDPSRHHVLQLLVKFSAFVAEVFKRVIDNFQDTEEEKDNLKNFKLVYSSRPQHDLSVAPLGEVTEHTTTTRRDW